MSIITGLHEKYGAHDKVAEFRLLALNNCSKACESCFYKRSGNQVFNYENIDKLASELTSESYRLEVCYLLPTDFFDNEDNYKLFDDSDFLSILSRFEYMGIASTLEGEGADYQRLYKTCQQHGIKNIELQINLVFEKIFDNSYIDTLKKNINHMRGLFKESIVFNLALNLGRKIVDSEFSRVEEIIKELSDDQIIEVNFTFLYNNMIQNKVKSDLLIESLRSMKVLSHMYNDIESKYNKRSFIHKPAFIFKEDRAYIAPIIPFDEYAFVDKEKFLLDKPSYESFLDTALGVLEENIPLWDECSNCQNLQHCMNKGYFVTASEYSLPCYLTA